MLYSTGVRVGEMTKDGKWIVTSCRCLGCCGLAPVMSVNGDVYGKLTKNQIAGIIDNDKFYFPA